MTLRRFIAPAVILASLVGAASAGAAGNMFMIVTGVKGQSTDTRYPGSSELRTLDVGFRRPEGAAHSQFDLVTVSKGVDSTSPFMFEHAGTGAKIPAIRIVVRSQEATPRSFLQYCLENAVVKSDHISGGGSVLDERVAFAPDKLEVRYTYLRSNGTSAPPVLAGWNIVTQTSIGFTATCAGTGN